MAPATGSPLPARTTRPPSGFSLLPLARITKARSLTHTGVEESWQRLLRGESAATQIEKFEASDLACRVACEVKRGDGSGRTFNADQFMEAKEQRRYDEFILYGVAAAKQAMEDSGYKAKTPDQQARLGVLVGSGIGGLPGIEETTLTLKEKGPRRVSPFFIPGSLINLAGGIIGIHCTLILGRA